MPAFLCCSVSASFSISSDEHPPPAPSAGREVPCVGSGSDVRAETTTAEKHAYKLHKLLDDALLPGQLPGSPGDAASGRSLDAEQKTGIPLLEDTLCRSTNARSHVSALGRTADYAGHPELAPDAPGRPAIGKLHIPVHLQSSSSCFAAEYRDGEPVTSAASFSARDDAPSPNGVWDLLEPPFMLATSWKSGQRRLCRRFQLGEMDNGTVEMWSSAASQIIRNGDMEKRGKQLQRELDTAAALPCCPLLLLPHRVYEQSDAVYVVYDSTGEYSDLYSLLRTKQRLPEAACRNVMRQLLQALSVLHERRWVHRNISSETVWVTEASQPLRPRSQLAARFPPLELTPQLALHGSHQRGPQSHPQQLPQQQALDAMDALTAAAVPVGSRSHSRTSGGSGGRRGSAGGGWVPVTDDTRRPPPPMSGNISSSSSSRGGGGCSDTCDPQQQEQLLLLHLKLGGLAAAARPEVEEVTGREVPLRELVGCAYHWAPEAISGAGYGRAADVWAAGVLLYMMLTGRPPFPGGNELEVMTRVLLAAAAAATTSGPTLTAATAATESDDKPGNAGVGRTGGSRVPRQLGVS
ncbi:hypothetical protein VOLCADRAFT_98797 [Volvox carteri f. nagariensis]|uniref:Protein kinase domain-containing protein n=1 Tax=Volvox carteri f. nagariensis TaxID=3068 RepID=D8UGB6_VOLCA|nr:uncharacterized protein VOLCADRAFT_98797 [Volvox carteri f. nagariensis]EFJ41261.1 hypothetical protein VOLCADRAFT_98797 [Volvox carteri f. nagariensis]|eukprot:XP_002957712.1 hypothetical protein VOLCADRAFT_98797 [Volvox carteri f. nagariensis]